MPDSMRVSDTERQRTVDELRRHCAAGRIDMDEYGRRIEQAMAAERLEELDAVLSDLPILRIADPSAAGEAAGRSRGESKQRRKGTRRLVDIPGLGTGQEPDGDRGLGGRGRTGDPEGTLASGRTASTLTAIVVIGLVVAAVVLIITASWAWAAVLIAGWVIGLIQSAVSRRRRG